MNTPKEDLIDFLTRFPVLSAQKVQELASDLNLVTFEKGQILIEQGQKVNQCYFILRGMVRKYGIDEEGVETTYGFFSENEGVVVFYQNDTQLESPYSFACVEHCVAIVGDLDNIEADLQKHPEFATISRQVMEDTLDQVHDHLAVYIRMSAEERVAHVAKTRPQLLERVPQHQLASYLGIKPESLSRIKRRLGL